MRHRPLSRLGSPSRVQAAPPVSTADSSQQRPGLGRWGRGQPGELRVLSSPPFLREGSPSGRTPWLGDAGKGPQACEAPPCPCKPPWFWPPFPSSPFPALALFCVSWVRFTTEGSQPERRASTPVGPSVARPRPGHRSLRWSSRGSCRGPGRPLLPVAWPHICMGSPGLLPDSAPPSPHLSPAGSFRWLFTSLGRWGLARGLRPGGQGEAGEGLGRGKGQRVEEKEPRLSLEGGDSWEWGLPGW